MGGTEWPGRALDYRRGEEYQWTQRESALIARGSAHGSFWRVSRILTHLDHAEMVERLGVFAARMQRNPNLEHVFVCVGILITTGVVLDRAAELRLHKRAHDCQSQAALTE